MSGNNNPNSRIEEFPDMNIAFLDTTAHPDYDNHELVARCVDAESGLHAYIAIHSRVLGPALGGCRMWPYPDAESAIKDVLRLSRGMTYKSAMAGLPLGGGKAVIVGDPRVHKTDALLDAMGRFVEAMNGKYITAEDSGTNVADLVRMARQTRWVAGIGDKRLSDGSMASGDPSPATAYGVYQGILAAVIHQTESDNLAGTRIAIQGVGNVGRHLAQLLAKAGANLFISDVDAGRIGQTLALVNATVVDAPDLHKQEVDVFAPCAMGGAINLGNLKEIKAGIIAGAANNQLADAATGTALFDRGLLYAPDYVINAGGIIDIYYEREGYEHSRVLRHIDRIGDTLRTIFRLSRERQQPTHVVADGLALERLGGPRISEVA